MSNQSANATTLINRVLASEHFDSVRSNPRLQWMLLAILALMLIYIGKISFDALNEGEQNLQQQASLYSRLLTTLESDIDAQQVQRWQMSHDAKLDELPAASSLSLAEANALSQLENAFAPLLERTRYNLVGGEEQQIAGTGFYKVRLEISGRLPTTQMSTFLDTLTQNRRHFLLQTLNYSPRASNTIAAVIDVIFVAREGANKQQEVGERMSLDSVDLDALGLGDLKPMGN